MPFTYTLMESLDASPHQYRAYAVAEDDDWQRSSAAEYVKLRTECSLPVEDISVDGITVMDVEGIRQRLKNATVPKRRSFKTQREMSFDVIRSDLGETLSFMLLDEMYATKFGYKSVRDRELIQLPGRGIDAVGIEDGDPLTLVLGETKVSNEESPPQVVDSSTDSLKAQHTEHLKDTKVTAAKIWNLARHVLDVRLRDLYFLAAFYLEEQRWEQLKIVACCVLVRPCEKYQQLDYGSFRAKPSNFAPADIRFLIICLPGDIDSIITGWYENVQLEQSS